MKTKNSKTVNRWEYVNKSVANTYSLTVLSTFICGISNYNQVQIACERYRGPK